MTDQSVSRSREIELHSTSGLGPELPDLLLVQHSMAL